MNRKRLFGLLFGAGAWCAVSFPLRAGLTIDMQADPPLPVQNLLQNSGFEIGEELPDGWMDQTGRDYKGDRLPQGGRSGAFLNVECPRSNILTSGFFIQAVAVQPDKTYVGGVWMRFGRGRGYLRLQPTAGPGSELHRISWIGSGLVPDFLSREQTGSPAEDEWVWVQTEVRTSSNDGGMTFGLGTYQERCSVDFDDAFLGDARTALSIKVSGGALGSVVLRNQAGREIWNSGDLGGRVSRIEHEIPDLPTMDSYELIATSVSGEETTKWYPEKRRLPND